MITGNSPIVPLESKRQVRGVLVFSLCQAGCVFRQTLKCPAPEKTGPLKGPKSSVQRVHFSGVFWLFGAGRFNVWRQKQSNLSWKDLPTRFFRFWVPEQR